MAITLKVSISDPTLVSQNMFLGQSLVQASQTHFGFSNMGSKMIISIDISNQLANFNLGHLVVGIDEKKNNTFFC